MKTWSFSLFLGLAYLAVFQLWTVLAQRWIIASGLGAAVLLSLVFARAAAQNYFWNRWDGLLHTAVILDLLLEAVFIPVHTGYGFYFCALGFACVIGGYRACLGRPQTVPAQPPAGSMPPP